QFALPSIRSDKNVKVRSPYIVGSSIKLKEFMLLVKVNFQRLLSPSTCGAIVGFIIGLIPQIRKTVIGLKGPQMQNFVLVGIMVVRYIVCPLIGIAVAKGVHRIGFVHSDPLYQFVLLLQFVLPPVSNISTITQLFGAGASECSVIMQWTYVFASLTITLWATFYMWLIA
ncbi:hypothetical protein GIB67_037419, partial [Kingdonia uniflora]